MASPSLVAAFLVLVPGMFAVGFVLRRFEGYFEQARLFFALTVGLFAGIVLQALRTFLFTFDDLGTLFRHSSPYTTGELVTSLAYTAVGLAMVAALATTVVLGVPKFRSRKDTAYYGTAFAMALAAMWCVPLVAKRLTPLLVDGFRADVLALGAYLESAVYAVGMVLGHGAMGAVAGRNVGEGSLWRSAMLGTLALVPLMAAHWLYATYPYTLMLAALVALVGVVAMALAVRRVLDAIVPAHIRDQVRRERRRAQRKGQA